MFGLAWSVKICYLNAFSILSKKHIYFLGIKKLRIFYSIYFNVFLLGRLGGGGVITKLDYFGVDLFLTPKP